MRAAALVIALGSVLTVTPSATAKGLALDRVCGESGCVTIEEDDLMVTLYIGAVQPEPPRLPYYRLDHRGPAVPSLHFVPARNLAGPMPPGGRRWFSLDATTVSAIRAAIRGLDPFPPPASWAIRSRGHAESRTRTLGAAVLLIALAVGAVLAQRHATDYRWEDVGAE
jgi:hypothetical protein